MAQQINLKYNIYKNSDNGLCHFMSEFFLSPSLIKLENPSHAKLPAPIGDLKGYNTLKRLLDKESVNV